MSNFPLYDSLSSDVSKFDLTTKQKDEFMKLVKNIDNEGTERIYVLIRMFQLENAEDKSTFKIPYGGKFIKTDLKFDLNDFPNELKNILYKFIKIHSSTMEEEIKIKKNRGIII
jgi:hypothetical protein